MAYWLFQANPKYYRIIDAIQTLDEIPWLVTRYSKQMSVGDGVFVWIAGAEAGIYAIAELIEAPRILSELPDPEYWLDQKNTKLDKPRVRLHFVRKLIGQPLRKHEIKNDSILKNLMVIRAPNSTNFQVTPEQWERVYQLKG